MCVGCLGLLLFRRRSCWDVRRAVLRRYKVLWSDPRSMVVLDSQSCIVFQNRVLTKMKSICLGSLLGSVNVESYCGCFLKNALVIVNHCVAAQFFGHSSLVFDGSSPTCPIVLWSSSSVASPTLAFNAKR